MDEQALINLINQSDSFSSSEKRIIVDHLATLSEDDKENLMGVFMKEKLEREQNRTNYIQTIHHINTTYGSHIDPMEELRKIDTHMRQKHEYRSTMENVQKHEGETKSKDSQDAENILHTL